MMLVDTYIAPSAIEGVGVFAAEPIRAGTPIWKFDPQFDRLIAKAEIDELPPAIRRFIDRYAYPLMTDPSYLVLESDNGRFMNHSTAPNSDFRDLAVGYALVDLAPDTEITCDYGEFDPGFEMQPSRHFLAAG